MRKLGVVWVLVAAVLFAGCVPSETVSGENSVVSRSEEVGSSEKPDSSAEDTASAQTVDEILEKMTLREKVGQLFFVRPDAFDQTLTPKQVNHDNKNGVTVWNEKMTARMEDYPAGGVVMFGKNIDTPKQLKTMISSMQQAAKTPLLFCVDEEGGRVARLANTAGFDLPTYDSMAAIGATGDPENAYAAGKTIGNYLKEYGFSVDFAPVADANTNPNNRVIGDRAFSNDPQTVSRMVSAQIDGFHEAGVLTCIKHFPGHGDTAADTHSGYVAVNKTWEELKACELIPFAENFEKTDFVMVAHITLPLVTDDGLPASLSAQLITEKLRGELDYSGLVVTDALSMGAINEAYTSAQAAVLALQAGNDVLLMSEDYAAAFDGVVQAVENGTLTEERIDESVRRILEAKKTAGLL